MRRAPLWAAATAAVVVGLAGCAAPDAPAGEEEAGTLPAAFAIDEDFPDPDVIASDDGYVAFATGMQGLNIRVATSSDAREWTIERRDALPKLPSWASPGRTWAPEVSEAPGGGYVMYVTAWDTASDRQCIGTAVSPSLDEPFTPVGDAPLVCPAEVGGAIDASTFVDADGTGYLLWKTDGNCCQLDTWIEIAPLSADGLALAGEPTQLIKQTLPWEGHLVEAPVLVERDGVYALFYSANDYGSDAYATGVATSDALFGPYEKADDPLLSTSGSDDRFIGPGGQDVVATPDGDVLVFHSWDELFTYRGLNARPLEWADGIPSVVLDD